MIMLVVENWETEILKGFAKWTKIGFGPSQELFVIAIIPEATNLNDSSPEHHVQRWVYRMREKEKEKENAG